MFLEVTVVANHGTSEGVVSKPSKKPTRDNSYHAGHTRHKREEDKYALESVRKKSDCMGGELTRARKYLIHDSRNYSDCFKFHNGFITKS